MAAKRRSGIVVGRLAGIDIRIHPTFLLLVALVLVGGFGPPVDGFVWIALVFSSVVFHELSHSLVARRHGVGVRDIVLLPIGGVSELERLPEHPADELAIAVAGPAASFALAVAAGATALVFGRGLLPVDLLHGAVLLRVAWLNLLLGTFNLLPAFPMDGGRVLRAWLAGRMSLEAATVRAARVGRVLAVGLAVVGLLADPWLLLIAAFVYAGSVAEEAATIVHARLEGLTVKDVMVRAPVTVDAGVDTSALDWLRHTTTQRHIPVTAAGRYVGVLDLGHDVPAAARTAGEAAEALPTAYAEEPLTEAFEHLADRRSPVEAVLGPDGSVVGLLVLADVGRLLAARR